MTRGSACVLAALLALGRPVKAAGAFDQAVGLDPAFAAGHANRGQALREQGRVDEALEALDRALALKPDYLEAFCNRGVCRLLAGDLARGFADHEARWRVGPGLIAATALVRFG